MRPWLEIPTKTRIELLREYKKLGYSYSSAKKDFESSLPKYEGGETLTPQIPNQQPFTVEQSTTAIANRNFELEAEARRIQAEQEENKNPKEILEKLNLVLFVKK